MNTAAIKTQIEKQVNQSIELRPDTDGVNLLFSAFAGTERIASVYKSFDSNFKQIVQIKYTLRD